jgi:hypothetical protein
MTAKAAQEVETPHNEEQSNEGSLSNQERRQELGIRLLVGLEPEWRDARSWRDPY